jgi:LCP family protein required for cell wall assembly
MLKERSRSRTLVQFLVAAIVVVACVTTAVAVGGLLQFDTAAGELGHNSALKNADVTQASAGAPQTILIIGSDHRAGEPFSAANTDTMMLLRLNSASSTINVLSIPRDLAVPIPEGGTTVTQRVNSAYSIGGPNLLIRVLRRSVFPGLQVNHIIDVNFSGFADIVNAIGCVYADVDHRYYNNTAQTNYSSIDVAAGYQKLCGTQALAFVRFRHTDSDLVRNARQQDFIRWAKDQYGVGNILANKDKLLGILGRNAVTDKGLHSGVQLIELFDLIAFSAGDAINQVKFPAVFEPCSAGVTNPATGVTTGATGCYVTATAAGKARVYREFLTPTTGVRKTTAAPAVSTARTSSSRDGLIADPADGKLQAEALGRDGMPIYYPARIESGTEYCSSITADCNDSPNPASEYIGAYPRQYELHDQQGRAHPAYRMTLVKNSLVGQYYGVEGTTWKTPPILQHPTQVQTVDGKRLQEYFDGHKLMLVAWVNNTGAYWVSNTLTDDIPNHQLIAIAASLTLGVN